MVVNLFPICSYVIATISSKIFYMAGVRPGGRGPFVSAKGPKTIFALAWAPGKNLVVPADARHGRRLRSSLRSDSPRRFIPALAPLLGRAKGNKEVGK